MNINAWRAEGLRWIASLFNAAADCLDRPRATRRAASEPAAPWPAQDQIDEVRLRMRSHLRGLI
jgi:hypothetical protein